MSNPMSEIPEELQKKLSLQQPLRSGRRGSHLIERQATVGMYDPAGESKWYHKPSISVYNTPHPNRHPHPTPGEVVT